MEPLRLFGIPITPVGYYMNCVLTNAQIDLIASDVGVIDYGSVSVSKSVHSSKPVSRSDLRRINDEWSSREDVKEGLSMKDIFRGNLDDGVAIKIR